MDSKEPIILNMHISARNPNRKNAHKGGSGLLISKEYSYAIETNPHSVVSGLTNGINTPARSTGKTTGRTNSTKETSKQLTLGISPTTAYSPAGFLARLSQLLGSEKDLKIHEAITSLISQGYSIPKNLECVFLKMSKDSFRTMMAIPSGQCSGSCMSWGTTFNGKCLTAKIGYRKPGNVQSLSAILEEHPDRKYFLSEKAKKGLFKNARRMRDKNMLGPYDQETIKTEPTL